MILLPSLLTVDLTQQRLVYNTVTQWAIAVLHPRGFGEEWRTLGCHSVTGSAGSGVDRAFGLHCLAHLFGLDSSGGHLSPVCPVVQDSQPLLQVLCTQI